MSSSIFLNIKCARMLLLKKNTKKKHKLYSTPNLKINDEDPAYHISLRCVSGNKCLPL